MKRRTVDATHPKSFVAFIIESIDEALATSAAPVTGTDVYWRAFHRFEDYTAERECTAAAADLRKAAARQTEWTV